VKNEKMKNETRQTLFALQDAKMWNGSSLQLINKTSPLLIGFGGNK
jgi:hypothetical protein